MSPSLVETYVIESENVSLILEVYKELIFKKTFETHSFMLRMKQLKLPL